MKNKGQFTTNDNRARDAGRKGGKALKGGKTAILIHNSKLAGFRAGLEAAAKFVDRYEEIVNVPAVVADIRAIPFLPIASEGE